jgi:hypothetical protein
MDWEADLSHLQLLFLAKYVSLLHCSVVIGSTILKGKKHPVWRQNPVTQCQALVAHTYNATYSGGRDQEDLSLKLAQANSLQDPI